MDSEIEAVVPALLSARRVVLTTHINPDGDGLGSEIAMAGWFAGRGREVMIINDSPTPAVYSFLDPEHRIRQFTVDRDGPAIDRADLIVVLDTNSTARLRAMEPYVIASRATKICIDHHLDPSPFATYYLIDDDATSTGEILYRLLTRLRGPDLAPHIAEALYCAIMTDTGSFRYPRVDPEIFRICARLIECGADPVKIFANVFERWSGGRVRLLGEMLAGLKTEYSGKLAYVTISRDMLARTDTGEEDTDNFTTFPMSVEGVLVGILFLELDKGVKISFRSKGEIPINELAREFGGNGHRNAAGARIETGTLAAIRELVVRSAGRFLS